MVLVREHSLVPNDVAVYGMFPSFDQEIMLELLNSMKASNGSDIPEAGDTLIAGTSTIGYYGFNRDIISGTSLASTIGLTAGTAINSNEGWLKYSYQGKVCYIAKKPFRFNLSWADVYRAGAVYGTDDNGTFPPTTGNRTQNARVTLSGKVFRVLLPRIKDADPSSSPISTGSLYDLFRRTRSEFGSNWGVQTYTRAELGQPSVLTENAAYNFTSTTYSNNTSNRLMFMYNNLTTISQIQHSSPATNLGWRPVLLEI